MEKKENNYRLLLNTNDKKNAELANTLKNKIKQLESLVTEKDEVIDKYQMEGKKLTEMLTSKTKELQESEGKREELKTDNGRLSKSESNLASEL
jgi:hypothetical protein